MHLSKWENDLFMADLHNNVKMNGYVVINILVLSKQNTFKFFLVNLAISVSVTFLHDLISERSNIFGV